MKKDLAARVKEYKLPEIFLGRIALAGFDVVSFEMIGSLAALRNGFPAQLTNIHLQIHDGKML